MTKSKYSLAPDGENLRKALRWLSENAPVTPATINAAACRCDLTPLEEEFLLNKFLPPQSWEHFHHAADIGVRGSGHTLEQAFAQAGLALTAIVTDPDKVQPLQEITIACEEADQELLFVDWLNRVIYEMVTGNMLFREYSVTIDGARLTATLRGEPIDRQRHEPAVEPKGATFTELKVGRQDNGTWLAQCVIDV